MNQVYIFMGFLFFIFLCFVAMALFLAFYLKKMNK